MPARRISILGQVDKAAPREFLTAAGLATSGARVRFRIYVILETATSVAARPSR